VKQPLVAAAVLCALAAVVLLTGLGRPDLFNPDEPREAEIAREMLVTGDSVVPQLNGVPFLEKPPLFYWLVVPVFRLAGGPSEGAARLVPAICGLLTVLLTWWMARALIGETAAILAALVLLTALQFFWSARRCMIDMPLTLVVLVACAALYRGMMTGGRGRPGWLILGYAACAVAVLFKGLVGAGIPALAALAWLAARRDARGLLRHGLVPGGVLALAPVALWVLRLHERLGPVAVREFVLVNNVLRFTGGAAKGHDNPFWYYIPTLLGDFAPWSLVLPLALVAALRAPARRTAAVRDLALWVLVPLVALSIASTKRGIYLLPIYPPAAMLVAWWITGGGTVATESARAGAGLAPAGRGRRAVLWVFFAGLATLSVALLVVLRFVRPADAIGPFMAAGVMALPASLAWQAARDGDGRRLGTAVAAGLGVLEVIAIVVVAPAIINTGTSARQAGSDIRRLSAAGDRVALYGIKEGTLGQLLFYAGRTLPDLRTPEDLRRHLDADAGGTGPRALVVMRAPLFDAAAAAIPFAIVEARRWPIRTAPWEPAGVNDFILAVRSP
jgi:4-amino-4-deoxy-L-arabinose transferase-like glycosyltransferase